MKGIKLKNKREDVEVLSDSNDPDDEIKTIYHMADIHIQRFNDRHEEYLKVFENLCDEIKKDTENALICVCGDVLHDKSQLSAPQIMLCKRFFIMISEYCPVLVIIGNHDVAPQNNCIDALTPILMNLNTKHRIYLLLDDKNYVYNNICFGVTTMFTDKITPIYDKNTRKVKIGLYHGMMDGAESDDGYKIGTKDHWNYKNFKKYYDIVLLGDVHKQMWLDPEKKVAYSGSLLQTRWGEGLEKGILKWNILTKESEFIKIYNEIGFIKMKANDQGIGYNEINENMIPGSLNIRLEYENITAEKAEEYVTELKNKYNVKSISLIRKINDNIEITVGKKNDKKKVIDINDNLIVIELIEKHMRSENEKQKYSEETIQGVKKKVKEILESMNFNYSNQVKNFTLKKLRFKNYFNYDDQESIIDYTKMEKIVGLIGNNYIGKSTCGIDALLYSIYGLTQRGEKADIIRAGSKVTTTNVEFEINGDLYEISRKRMRQTNKRTKKDTTEEVVLKKNGENISKDTVAETNKEITQIVCEYDDFINTSMVPQQGTYSFIDLPAKDQKNFISCLLKFDVFSEIISRAKSQKYINDMFMCNLRNIQEAKDGKKTKKTYDKYEVIKTLNQGIKTLNEKLSESDERLKTLTKKLDELLRDSYKYTSKKEELGDISNFSTDGIPRMKSMIQRIEKEIDDNVHRIHGKQIEQNQLKKSLEENEQLLEHIIEENCDQYDDIEQRNEKWKSDRQTEINELNDRRDQLLSKRVPDQTLKQMFTIPDSKEWYEKETIRCNLMKEQEIELKEMIEFKNSELQCDWLSETKQGVESMHKQYIDALSEKQKIIELIKAKTNQLESLNKKLDQLKNHVYDKNCKYCLSYPLTCEKIKCQEEIIDTMGSINHCEEEMTKIELLINQLKEGEDQYTEWLEIYQWDQNQNDQIKKMNNELNLLHEQIKDKNRMINNYQTLQGIKNETKTIDIESMKICQRICELTKMVFTQYEEYKKYKEKEIYTKNMISMKQIELDKINNQIDRINNQITVSKTEHTKQSQILDQLTKYQELQNKYKNINQLVEKNQRELNDEKKRNQDINNQLIILGENLKDAEKKTKEYETKEADNQVIDALIETVDKKGLIDNILSNTVMPKIEDYMNELLDQVSEYRIRIEYENGNFKIYKINGSGTDVTNIRTISGYEKFVCNLCFKLALNTGFNNFLKTKFLIIDEAFTSCDDNSINNKLPSLFNYIRENYKFAIVITHEERIKPNFDEQIEVIKLSNGNSRICC